MNHLPASASAPPRLDDRYDLDQPQVLVSGMQALVRLLLEQHELDRRSGRRTGAFVSGYRGSPLGRLDAELWAAKRQLAPREIHFQPGVNEELAATAIWGAQQAGLLGPAKVDGVFGLWYGKGPGVDRCGDVFKHANMAGTSPNGGVLAVAGDDHGAKSSTIAHQSEQALIAAMMPVLAPADLREVIEYGLLGYAMSRYAGCWTGLKITTQVGDSTATVPGLAARPRIREPEHDARPAGGLSIRWPEDKLRMEARLVEAKLAAARAFARANAIDACVWGAKSPRLGVVTVGKAHGDTLEALRLAGIDARRGADLGLAVFKVAMPWPLEPEAILAFATTCERILVVEEKRGLVEPQLKELLFDRGGPQAPRILGKTDATGSPLLPGHGELSPRLVLQALAALIPGLEGPALPVVAGRPLPDLFTRKEFFCAGCPHNRSTRVPDGSIALGGIGCHTMASRMPDRQTATVCQMGGEGATWIGQARFVSRKHVFQNLGDGTYFHSGLLAIRAAIAAGVNITYKILHNDAVAMTGGQPVDGTLGVEEICAELAAEGARRIVVVTDEPERPRRLPDGVAVRSRQDMDAVQQELREVEGVSILIYEQVCAAEKRRRRKRKLTPDPPKRLFINDRVCEGCGDCVRASSCIAVAPVETPLGRKRAIDQSACNKDFSCLEGFCPSFVEVEGAGIRRADSVRLTSWLDATPEPPRPPTALEKPHRVLITGIGGTGVVTIGALLAMAAHLDGHACAVLDMTGLAQKNGAVASHVTLAVSSEQIAAVRIGAGAADALIACDAIVAASQDHLALLGPGTHAVVNGDVTPTAGVIFDLNARVDAADLVARIQAAGGELLAVPATAVARRLLGDAVFANMLLLGVAWQQGEAPVSLESLRSAIQLNGAAVEANLAAFELGRRVGHAGLGALSDFDEPPSATFEGDPSDVVETHRRAFLSAYQDPAYAERYSAWMRRLAALGPELASVAAEALFKLMAIKDEYEIARLYTDGAFRAALNQEFAEVRRVRIHLAPPFLARRDPKTGLPRKTAFGPWIFPLLRALASFKRVRGTPLDPFGHTTERRRERRLLADYEALLAEVLASWDGSAREGTSELLAMPLQVRGFGHIKAAAMDRYEAEMAEKLQAWRSAQLVRSLRSQATEKKGEPA